MVRNLFRYPEPWLPNVTDRRTDGRTDDRHPIEPPLAVALSIVQYGTGQQHNTAVQCQNAVTPFVAQKTTPEHSTVFVKFQCMKCYPDSKPKHSTAFCRCILKSSHACRLQLLCFSELLWFGFVRQYSSSLCSQIGLLHQPACEILQLPLIKLSRGWRASSITRMCATSSIG